MAASGQVLWIIVAASGQVLWIIVAASEQVLWKGLWVVWIKGKKFTSSPFVMLVAMVNSPRVGL